jgi:hypothetical protein
MEQPPRAALVARRFLSAFVAGDLDALVSLADPCIEVRPLRITGQAAYRGHDGLRVWLEDVRRVALQPSFEVEDVEAIDDERVLARVRVEIAGEKLSVRAVLTIAHGLVSEVRGYFSDEDTLRAVRAI